MLGEFDMGEVFDLEKKYLQYTEKIIETEIKKSLYDEECLKKDSIKLSFEDRLRYFSPSR